MFKIFILPDSMYCENFGTFQWRKFRKIENKTFNPQKRVCLGIYNWRLKAKISSWLILMLISSKSLKQNVKTAFKTQHCDTQRDKWLSYGVTLIKKM